LFEHIKDRFIVLFFPLEPKPILFVHYLQIISVSHLEIPSKLTRKFLVNMLLPQLLEITPYGALGIHWTIWTARSPSVNKMTLCLSQSVV